MDPASRPGPSGSGSERLRERIAERIRDWHLVTERSVETENSWLVFATRGTEPVVLKVVKAFGDEWHSGEIAEAFDGHGMVRVHASAAGSVLLERLRPGDSLASLAVSGRDEEATEILAGVIARLVAGSPPATAVPVRELAAGFDRYLLSDDDRIPRKLVERGQAIYLELCASQTWPRLLHGDLHHYNILFDKDRGWLAIDPKGLVGEPEYELGAALRNPYERPELFAVRPVLERRLRCLEARLGLDSTRVLGWSYAQAILGTIWSVEDGFPVDRTYPCLKLAVAIEPMLTK